MRHGLAGADAGRRLAPLTQGSNQDAANQPDGANQPGCSQDDSMSLKIRLARGGAKKRPFYSIVIADSRSPRDGRFIEKVGTYNPMLERVHAERVTLKAERIKHWLGVGALPTERVARFLGDAGLIEKPAMRETPKKSAPKAKAQERAKAAAEAAARRPGAAERMPERHRHCACFETRRALLGMRDAIDGTRHAPHPEEAATQPSRRTHGAGPAGAKAASASGSSPAPHGVRGAVRIKSFTASPKTSPPMAARGRERRAVASRCAWSAPPRAC